MNCQELTIFLQKVLDKKDLIRNPENDFDGISALMQEIDGLDEKIRGPHNLGLRSLLAKRLNLDFVGDFNDGWALAEISEENRQSFVNERGEFIKDTNGNTLYFNEVDIFSCGIAVVQPLDLDEKPKFLRTDGSFLPLKMELSPGKLSDYRFSEGYAQIHISDSSQALIDTKGKEFRRCDLIKESGFHEGFAVIEPIGKGGADYYQFLGKDGALLNTEDGVDHFDQASDFYGGIAPVRIGPKWYFIDLLGKYLRDKDSTVISIGNQEILYMFPGKEGWFCVRTSDGHYMFLNKDLKVLRFEDGHEKFLNNVAYFSEGWALVSYKIEIGGKLREIQRFVNPEGRFLKDEDGRIVNFEFGHSFEDGLALVFLHDSGYVYLDQRGNVFRFGDISNLERL